MSADNWGICPRCKRDAEAALEAERHRVRTSYGKVSSDDYSAALTAVEAKAASIKGMEPTFREDYEVGMYVNGWFHVNYTGGCTKCGYGHHFTHEEVVTP